MSARDDYHVDTVTQCYESMCDQNDKLRLDNAWLRNIADGRGEENERLRRLNGCTPVRSRGVFCDATNPDSECEGWIWVCSLMVDHLGPHRCAGAAW